MESSYTTYDWETLCKAVAALKIRRVGAEVVPLRLVANAGSGHVDTATDDSD